MQAKCLKIVFKFDIAKGSGLCHKKLKAFNCFSKILIFFIFICFFFQVLMARNYSIPGNLSNDTKSTDCLRIFKKLKWFEESVHSSAVRGHLSYSWLCITAFYFTLRNSQMKSQVK